MNNVIVFIICHRCRQLTNAVDRARVDADIARSDLQQLEEQMTQKIAIYEKRLASMTEREILTMEVSQSYSVN
jgi:hypothetical protein